MIEKRTILVRYDEIGLKGGNRKYFTKILLKNIKRALPGDRGIEYRVPRGRILIDLPKSCLLYTSPSPRDATLSGMAWSA